MPDLPEQTTAATQLAHVALFGSDNSLPIPTLDIISFAFEKISDLNPDRLIYVDASDPKSHIRSGGVQTEVYKLKQGLVAHGLKAGDCVCIHSFNSIWYPLLWLAVVAAGGIVAGSNPAYTPTELVHHLKITDTKFIIAQAECLEAVKEALSSFQIPTENIFVLGNDQDPNSNHSFKSIEVLKQHDGSNDERLTFDDNALQETSVAVYANTSGTTGLPKAAELTHKYVVAQVTALEHVLSKRNESIRQLVCLPTFHAFAAQLAIVLPLRMGITTYFMPRFKMAEYLHNVDRFQITDSALVPPIMSALLDVKPHLLRSLRYVTCAGAPMTPELQAQLYYNLDPAATVAQCWGTTETGWTTVFEHHERDDSGSVGRLLPNTVLKIVDEHGNSVQNDNTAGEARIKSASMFRGYHNNSIANATAFDKDGFFCTGDRVYMSCGRIFIDGRIKDIIKVNGWQVSPEEIEHVLYELRAVEDCAVAGHRVTNLENGLEEFQPRAYVVRKVGHTITKTEIEDHVAQSLVRYKRLTGGVVFLDAIPRSNTGKILRRKLSQMDVQANYRDEICQNEVVVDKELYERLVLSEEEAIDQTSVGLPLRKLALMMTIVLVCNALLIPALVIFCFGLRRVMREGDSEL